MAKCPAIVAIAAGTPKVLGFDEALRKQFPQQFIDVGIAEEHAVALSSGVAKNGGRPVFGVSSSFLQRTYNQLSHDLALNRSPAVILVFFAGISQGSQTHMGVSDIAMVRSIPGLVCLAPTCKEEYLHMLGWALGQSVREKLEQEHQIHATLINPRYSCAVDETMLNALPGTATGWWSRWRTACWTAALAR